ncbi:MAG: hypothetical protein A3J28_16065 [Acidobacteria bacterium RIFCSPLOWO2_12_FULL_60_22]|nr:MAG: hypothetical protein A3J28_16065 [Acidobacteria bacterium RIFCSPLOWO2_12_FULL_60_22]
MSIPRFFLTIAAQKKTAAFLRGLLGSGAGVLLLGAVLGVRPAQASHQEAQVSTPMLFRVRCALCHYTDKVEMKFAPSLKDLFKRQNLITGKPMNEQNVSEIISNGSPNMPAFRHTLTEEEIRRIVDFLKGL